VAIGEKDGKISTEITFSKMRALTEKNQLNYKFGHPSRKIGILSCI